MSIRKKGLPSKKRMRHNAAHYVDDLVRVEGEVVGRMIDIEQIFPNPDQPRKDFGDVDSLAESIREQGVLEPILVNKEHNGYRIISGERRYRASTKVGLSELPCIIKNLDENQIMEIALVENLQRKDLHPLEEADGLKVLSKTYNYTHDHIAKKIGKSRSSVTEMLSLATLSPVVRQAAVDAEITAKTMLLGVARIDNEEEQLQMIHRIATGANRDDVRRKAKKQERSRPFVFRYKHPKKSFSLNLKFRKSEVEQVELVEALESILVDLKQQIAAELTEPNGDGRQVDNGE